MRWSDKLLSKLRQDQLLVLEEMFVPAPHVLAGKFRDELKQRAEFGAVQFKILSVCRVSLNKIEERTSDPPAPVDLPGSSKNSLLHKRAFKKRNKFLSTYFSAVLFTTTVRKLAGTHHAKCSICLHHSTPSYRFSGIVQRPTRQWALRVFIKIKKSLHFQFNSWSM